ncbi:hypothetical protein E2C01_002684 [Portunus trituberculatus]|uniref:Uncharacterized protein n=1 Tax=Portunus trituberculatus TaxID=210409 RepID=A0A5B7CKE1_PORTR|nr:hypothetical protein [Portunus trituberculatus]
MSTTPPTSRHLSSSGITITITTPTTYQHPFYHTIQHIIPNHPATTTHYCTTTTTTMPPCPNPDGLPTQRSSVQPAALNTHHLQGRWTPQHAREGSTQGDT